MKPHGARARRAILPLALLAVAAVVAPAGCAQVPEPGTFGPLRLAGRVAGDAPLNLLPPVADRGGNVYVLYGGIDLPQTIVFAGKNGGGWASGCSLTKGDSFGVHGWIGYTEDSQWYWSGDALVQVSGASGDCHRVLDTDPGTDANLLFRAVLPWVRDAPSRVTTVALVQSPVDLLPFTARVDLEDEILTNIRAFDPPDAANVKVVGVGADRETNEGVVLLQYTRGSEIRSEARFYDADASLVAKAAVPLPEQTTEFGVLGFLQFSAGGLVAGLLRSGEVVSFDKAGGKVRPIDKITPAGVHRWEGKLFVVGTADARPALAELDDGGRFGPVQLWTSSFRASENLRRPLEVRDDRALPSTTTTFATPRSAMGAFPFLHPHALTRHATGTSLWLVAGPSFDTGGSKVTAFAMAPVGVSYP